MPQPTEPRNRKVAVLARDASGAPVFVAKVIVATDTQVAQGVHYDLAIEQVRAERYEPKFAFDETDVAARQLVDLAGWFYGAGATCAAVPHKARVQTIELERQEGEPASWRATTFAAANRVLRDWACSAPAHGGYDKVRVRIIWTNAQWYEYRLDLKHPSTSEQPDVMADLAHTVHFALGRKRNPEWSDAQHEQVLRRYREQGVVAHLERIDARCALTDA